MSNSTANAATAKPTLFVGIDWSDQKHDLYWMHGVGRPVEAGARSNSDVSGDGRK